jgi:hypothetical protein
MQEDREPEIWKPIPEYEGLYEVSSWGRVRKLLIIEPTKSQSGYPMIQFQVDKKRFNKTLHLLVAESFCEKKEYHKVVNHKDSDVLNPYYNNLEWVSIRENVSHSKKGENYSSKYTGVGKRVNGKYYASISIYGKRKYLGTYNTEEEAHYVYMKVIEALGEENKYYKKGFKFRKDLDLSVIDNIYKAKTKTSIFKGVHLDKNSGRWKATLNIKKVVYNLGFYTTEEEAYKAYVTAVEKYKK